MIVMALYRHKAETVDNKRLLENIMQRWGRPIFNKQIDARNGNGGARDTAELREVLQQRIASGDRRAEENAASSLTIAQALEGQKVSKLIN